MMYHYEINGEKFGPVERSEIQTLLDRNALSRDSKIWCEDFEDWKMVSETDFDLKKMGPPPLSGESINNNYLWALAFAPLIGYFLQYTLSHSVNANVLVANISLQSGKYWYVSLGLNIFLSVLDEKQLSKAGHDTKKFKGWIWLVPVYIYKRVEATRLNFSPFIIWVVTFILTLL